MGSEHPRKKWFDVPLPPMMRNLPRDGRGFPVPFIVLRDGAGKPHFAANDTRTVNRCILENLCGVCGNFLADDRWMLGGPKSAFHPRGVYVDSPIHHECGEYALQVCPYLVLSGYRAPADRTEKLSRTFHGTAVFVNPTQDYNRVPFFVFAKTSGITVLPTRHIVPNRPFLAVEFWLDGEQISESKAVELAGVRS